MDSSNTPTPDEQGADAASERSFKLAEASLRRALADVPDLTDVSQHLVIEESTRGLNLQRVDQDGESMFPQGSKEPSVRMRRIIEALTGSLKAVPFRVSIVGHTATTQNAPPRGFDKWQLSIDRANVVRQILEELGYPSSQI